MSLSYMWPHVDMGKSQTCARFIFGDGMYKYSHGETIAFGNRKGTFRLIDKEYDKEWLRANMSAIKEEWKNQQEKYYEENL